MCRRQWGTVRRQTAEAWIDKQILAVRWTHVHAGCEILLAPFEILFPKFCPKGITVQSVSWAFFVQIVCIILRSSWGFAKLH